LLADKPDYRSLIWAGSGGGLVGREKGPGARNSPWPGQCSDEGALQAGGDAFGSARVSASHPARRDTAEAPRVSHQICASEKRSRINGPPPMQMC